MQLVTWTVHRILLIIVHCAACDRACALDIVDNCSVELVTGTVHRILLLTVQCGACNRGSAPDIVDTFTVWSL